MAAGKMSGRQKMINLMYLVFIAMLAMNMSKEVLSAFGFMNEKLTENNLSTTLKNSSAYENLATKASEQAAKFGVLYEDAKKIKKYSSDFYTYLDSLKMKMTASIEDKTDYESMDKTDFLDEYFFEGDGFTEEGKEFLNQINSYKSNLIKIVGEKSQFAAIINKRFNTDDVPVRDTNKKTPWLKARYEGFPMIASLTNFTQVQADIKNTESDILTSLLGGKLEESLSLSNYTGIVSLDKTAYFAGEKVTGKVVLGRYDATLVPNKVILNGAVVSADKMNVVYRGLDNPISVSLPGVGANNINVSASGGVLSGSNGKFSLKPGGGNEAVVNVSAKLSSGKTVSSRAVFRIKDIPPAMGSVREQYGIVSMPKTGLANAPIAAGLPDFEFDVKIVVQGFKIKVPGQLTIIVNGSTLNAAAKAALSKAQRGDIINIYDIQATADGVPIKKVLPVSIDITN